MEPQMSLVQQMGQGLHALVETKFPDRISIFPDNNILAHGLQGQGIRRFLYFGKSLITTTHQSELNSS